MRPSVCFHLLAVVAALASANGGTRPDLHLVAAKAAAAAARALPGATAEVSGTVALVSRDTRHAPNEDFSRPYGVRHGQGYANVPTDNGMMFVVRIFPGGPKLHMPLEGALGQFDRRGAAKHIFYLEISSIGHADTSDVTVMIEVMFGPATNDAELRAGYAAIKSALVRELGS